MDKNKKSIDLSVIIPVYNEEKVLEELRKRLEQVLRPLSLNYEVIFTNCNSHDQSWEIIKGFRREDGRYKYLSFSHVLG